MTINCSPEYVKGLEELARNMAHALVLSESVLEAKGHVSPEIVKQNVGESIKGYYDFHSKYAEKE